MNHHFLAIFEPLHSPHPTLALNVIIVHDRPPLPNFINSHESREPKKAGKSLRNIIHLLPAPLSSIVLERLTHSLYGDVIYDNYLS